MDVRRRQPGQVITEGGIRGGGPGGGGGPGEAVMHVGASPRFLVLLDQLHHEYNGALSEIGGGAEMMARELHDEYQRQIDKCSRDLATLDAALIDLTSKHQDMKRRYEAEIGKLKNILAYHAGVPPLKQSSPGNVKVSTLMDTVIAGSSSSPRALTPPTALTSHVLSHATSAESGPLQTEPYPRRDVQPAIQTVSPQSYEPPPPPPQQLAPQHMTGADPQSHHEVPSSHTQPQAAPHSYPHEQQYQQHYQEPHQSCQGPHQQTYHQPQQQSHQQVSTPPLSSTTPPVPSSREYSHHSIPPQPPTLPQPPQPPQQLPQHSPQPPQQPQPTIPLSDRAREYQQPDPSDSNVQPSPSYHSNATTPRAPNSNVPVASVSLSLAQPVRNGLPVIRQDQGLSNNRSSPTSPLTPNSVANHNGPQLANGRMESSGAPSDNRVKVSHEISTSWASLPPNGHTPSAPGPRYSADRPILTGQPMQSDDRTAPGYGRRGPLSITVSAAGGRRTDGRALIEPRTNSPEPPATPGVVTTYVAPDATSTTSTKQLIADPSLDFVSLDGIPPNPDDPEEDFVMLPEMECRLLYTMQHDSVVCCVKYSNDGKFLATGSNRAAHIFDQETGKQVGVFTKDRDRAAPGNSNAALVNDNYNATRPSGDLGLPNTGKSDSYVRAVCFSPENDLLVTGAEDHMVKIWDIKTKTVRHKLVGHETDIYSVDVSKDGRFIVSGSGDRRAKVWSLETGKQLITLGGEYGPMDGITSVSVSPSCRHVAAGSLDKLVRIWDVETGRLVRQFNAHRDSVYSVAFSQDGKTLVSGSLDRTVRLWDLVSEETDRQCQISFNGHTDFVLSVVYSWDGRHLVSASKDRTIRWWDFRNDTTALKVHGHRNSVICIDHNPKQQRVASGSGDRRMRGWLYMN